MATAEQISTITVVCLLFIIDSHFCVQHIPLISSQSYYDLHISVVGVSSYLPRTSCFHLINIYSVVGPAAIVVKLDVASHALYLHLQNICIVVITEAYRASKKKKEHPDITIKLKQQMREVRPATAYISSSLHCSIQHAAALMASMYVELLCAQRRDEMINWLRFNKRCSFMVMRAWI